MKSDPSEYKGIIKKLLEKTREGRVEWTTGFPRGSFSCTLGGSTRTSIIAPPNEQGQFSFTLMPQGGDDRPALIMLDRTDNEIFRAVANDLPTSPEEEENSVLIEELYDLARRQALKIEQKLDLASTLLDHV